MNLTNLTSPFGAARKKLDELLSTKERRSLAYSFALSLLCFGLGIITQSLYFKDTFRSVDVEAFQNCLYGKEEFAKSWMERIRKKIAEGQLSDIYNETSLYDESEKNEVDFHVYKGDSLLFWSRDVVGGQSDVDFDLEKSVFVRSDNMCMVALQTFFREYRCVAMIKIKESYSQKQNSSWNSFAKSFDLPGSVIVSEVQQDGFSPIFSSSGNNRMS